MNPTNLRLGVSLTKFHDLSSCRLLMKSSYLLTNSCMSLHFQDEDFIPSMMDGHSYQAGQYAGSLRMTLFKQHLGLLDPRESRKVDIRDPISDSFYKEVWLKIASTNTAIYEKVLALVDVLVSSQFCLLNCGMECKIMFLMQVFSVFPTDDIRTWAELEARSQKLPLSVTDPGQARTLLTKTRGYLVFYPLFFLDKENLLPQVGTKEHLLPTAVFI